MSAHLLLIVALLGGDAAAKTPVNVESPVALLEQEVVTGTLIFSQGDCLAVKMYTQSKYTHVGIVIRRNDSVIVYDATSGKGVRSLTLANYLADQNPAEIYVFHPRTALSDAKARQLEKFLDSQLGRPYDIAHHVTGKRSAGVHCAEYATDALMSCHLMHAENPSRVSPASLAVGIVESEVYQPGRTVTLIEETSLEESPAEMSWCSQMWLDTKVCTSNFCGMLKRKVMCQR
ncbi:MAG: YiiX/YebB-like N1pC/P60 family cysteine hydrolase [Planctomycetaceae bacterium]